MTTFANPQIKLTATLPSEVLEALETWLTEASMLDWVVVQPDPLQAEYQLTGYFNTQEEAWQQWDTVRQHFTCLSDLPTCELLQPTDWQNAYKAYLQPWSCGNLHWVPIWQKETYLCSGDEAVLYLDAGMAFGTGAHETTRLCAEGLLRARDLYAPRLNQVAVIDAGCGSGILALSAAALGFQNVIGFDIDPDAVRTSQSNATLNRLQNNVTFFQASLAEGLKPLSADLLLANIQADALVACADLLLKALRPHGTLILSGVLVKELHAVKAHFCKQLEALSVRYTFYSQTQAEWAMLCWQLQ